MTFESHPPTHDDESPLSNGDTRSSPPPPLTPTIGTADPDLDLTLLSEIMDRVRELSSPSRKWLEWRLGLEDVPRAARTRAVLPAALFRTAAFRMPRATQPQRRAKHRTTLARQEVLGDGALHTLSRGMKVWIRVDAKGKNGHSTLYCNTIPAKPLKNNEGLWARGIVQEAGARLLVRVKARGGKERDLGRAPEFILLRRRA